MAGSITRYVYDGEDILLEYEGSNTFVARYSHGDQVDQPLILQKAGLDFFYYHSNHQGSITHLTDSSGTVANSYVYGSYGRRLSVFESVIQPFSYTGREYDVESELYYYRARYLDAHTGRFLSEDPIGFDAGDQNLYRYVFNNPTNLSDPTGTQGNSGGGAGFLLGFLIGTIEQSFGLELPSSSFLPIDLPFTLGRKEGRDFVKDTLGDKDPNQNNFPDECPGFTCEDNTNKKEKDEPSNPQKDSSFCPTS